MDDRLKIIISDAATTMGVEIERFKREIICSSDLNELCMIIRNSCIVGFPMENLDLRKIYRQM